MLNTERIIKSGLSLLGVFMLLAVSWFFISGGFGDKSSTAPDGDETIDITGEIRLEVNEHYTDMNPGVRCEGRREYSDISRAAQLVIRDSESSILAVSELSSGTADGQGSCIFDFQIDTVPAVGSYHFDISVSARGGLERFTYQELADNDFHAAIHIQD